MDTMMGSMASVSTSSSSNSSSSDSSDSNSNSNSNGSSAGGSSSAGDNFADGSSGGTIKSSNLNKVLPDNYNYNYNSSGSSGSSGSSRNGAGDTGDAIESYETSSVPMDQWMEDNHSSPLNIDQYVELRVQAMIRYRYTPACIAQRQAGRQHARSSRTHTAPFAFAVLKKIAPHCSRLLYHITIRQRQHEFELPPVTLPCCILNTPCSTCPGSTSAVFPRIRAP
jgi:hypothetical protein